jgi:hypothetical protein
MRQLHSLAAFMMGLMACTTSPSVHERANALTGSADEIVLPLDPGTAPDEGSGAPITPAADLPNPAPPADPPANPAPAPPADPPAPPPAPPPPSSEIEVSYDDGHPGSLLTSPPSVSQRCWIPKAVLIDKPIYEGDPKMTACDITTTAVGEPPTSITVRLYCGNGPGAAYDYFTCSQTIALVPPKTSSDGFFSYGVSGKVKDLDDKTCAAYITRALSICEVTGKQVEAQ